VRILFLQRGYQCGIAIPENENTDVKFGYKCNTSSASAGNISQNDTYQNMNYQQIQDKIIQNILYGCTDDVATTRGVNTSPAVAITQPDTSR